MYFCNPVLGGDYPDPSILKVGDMFYMTHSSSHFAPGLLIWKSADLVIWTPVTYALQEYAGTIAAPDFICHDNLYYIYFPVGRSDHSHTNCVIMAPSPEGPWSRPIDLRIPYIDPGHIVDRRGNRWLFLSNGKAVPLSADGLSTSGPVRDAYPPWPIPQDWNVGNLALESPKLFFYNDWYYLTVAEGGTAGPATSHMAAVMRSKDIGGDWEFSPYNPVVHTWSREETWYAKGHGTAFKDHNGRWWIVYHGYEKQYLNLGRQTLLEPLEWTDDGWFHIPEGVKSDNPLFAGDGAGTQIKSQNIGDDTLKNGRTLQWQFINPNDSVLGNEWTKDGLILDNGIISCVPVDHSYTTEVSVELEGENPEALLSVYYNDAACCGIGFNCEGFFVRRRRETMDMNKVSLRRARLRLVNDRNEVACYIDCLDGKGWIKSIIGVDTAGFNHNNFGNFNGCRVTLSALKGRVRYFDFTYYADKT
jgi:beta-xylosidase